MTYEEIVHEYRKMFIMLVEKAGRKTGNTGYLKVEEILKDSRIEEVEKQLIEDEPAFVLVVCTYLVNLFCGIFGVENVEGWDREKSARKLSEFYKEFLKGATIKFCEKYGIESFDDPETSFKLIVMKDEKGNNNK